MAHTISGKRWAGLACVALATFLYPSAAPADPRPAGQCGGAAYGCGCSYVVVSPNPAGYYFHDQYDCSTGALVERFLYSSDQGCSNCGLTLGGECPSISCPGACGDGVCNGGETCGSCPEDCGACACTPSEGDETCCDQYTNGPVNTFNGLLQVGPVADVHLIGAFDDDLIVQRWYSSGRDPQAAPTRQAPIGAGWIHNLQPTLLELGDDKIGFVREDGERYLFKRHSTPSDTSVVFDDVTGRGWTLGYASAGLAGCDPQRPAGLVAAWMVVADDGRCWDFDATRKLLSRRTRTGLPVRFTYDAQGRLYRVGNSSGQVIELSYDLSNVSRVAAIALVAPASAPRAL
ncbi:MAG TPA: DUF6531 domain-containing protein, partial [Polyangia bacterium]